MRFTALLALAIVLFTQPASAGVYKSLAQFKKHCQEGASAYFNGLEMDFRHEKNSTKSNHNRVEVKSAFALRYFDETRSDRTLYGSANCYTLRDGNEYSVQIELEGIVTPLTGRALECFGDKKFLAVDGNTCVKPRRNNSLQRQHRKPFN